MIKFGLFILISFHTLNACSGAKMNQKVKTIYTLPATPDSSMHCDITIIKRVESHLGKLEYIDMLQFLYTFSKDCSKNVEYSEYSNEVLFKVLERYPKELIFCMSKEEGIDLDYIYSELATPIHDINGDSIYEKVQNVSGDNFIKLKILEALKKTKDY